jgi:hypothetical protein
LPAHVISEATTDHIAYGKEACTFRRKWNRTVMYKKWKVTAAAFSNPEGDENALQQIRNATTRN